MALFIIGCMCALVFLMMLAVRRAYYCLSAKEWKRLARLGDPVGKRVHQAVAFDGDLAVTLWFLISGFGSASFVLFGMALPAWVAATAVSLVLWLGFAWLMSAPPHKITVTLASLLAPFFAWLLGRTHPVVAPLNRFIRQHRRVFDHTGLYEKQDIVELLHKQQSQADSRVAAEEVELLQRALEFGEKAAGDIAMPRQQLRLVRTDETIGPKLMDELHQSGLRQFPVVDAEEHVIGLVQLDDLVRAKQGGSVQDLTDPNLTFVRDDFSLLQALQIFRQSKQNLLIVINNFEEFLSVITLDRLLGQLLGESPGEATVPYEDRHAIAAYQQTPTDQPPSESTAIIAPETTSEDI